MPPRSESEMPDSPPEHAHHAPPGESRDAPPDRRGAVELSLVVPVFDEEENLPELHAEIVEHVGSMGVPWEVVYVDDRSRDR